MATEQSAAKKEILARINSALGGSSSSSPSTPTPPRAYRQQGVKEGEDLLSVLIDRLEDYDATVTRVGKPDLPGTIRDLVVGGKSNAGSLKHDSAAGSAAEPDGSREDVIIAPATIPDEWVSELERGKYSVLRDDVEGQSLTQEQINSSAAVITGSAVTVADTGTIVLAGPESGRRIMTLLPDHHVVVVPESSIVELVPEAMTYLRDHGLHTEPMTLVSGPSATVDIELIRVHGVHGPRQLDVVIVAD